MASSHNLASLEPWSFRPFSDSWFSEAFARDNDTLTKALQKSLCNTEPPLSEFDSTNYSSPFIHQVKPEPTPTPTTTGSGSDPDTLLPPKQRRNSAVSNGKIAKRKSRATKKSQTTFITADPANFRQMVQQVTGIRFRDGHVAMAPVLKPEAHRPGNRILNYCLPTLDTSEAFLLDNNQPQHHLLDHQTPASATSSGAQDQISFAPPVVEVGSGSGSGSGLGLGSFDSGLSFPTLESWRVK